MSREKFYHRRFGKKIITKTKSLMPPPPPNPKWSAPQGLHYFVSCQPPRSFRASFLDPFSPPSSLSLSLELARLTGCKFRMDVLSLVRYRCYDHDILQSCGWLGILILCFGFDYFCQRGNLATQLCCLDDKFIMPRNVRKNSQILRNPLKFAFLTIFGCK